MARTSVPRSKRLSRARLNSVIEPLEGRVLLAITPADPRANTLGAAFDRGERQVLLGRLTNLPTEVYADLQARLKVSPGKFDTGLLNYMRGAGVVRKFFYDPCDIT